MSTPWRWLKRKKLSTGGSAFPPRVESWSIKHWVSVFHLPLVGLQGKGAIPTQLLSRQPPSPNTKP